MTGLIYLYAGSTAEKKLFIPAFVESKVSCRGRTRLGSGSKAKRVKGSKNYEIEENLGSFGPILYGP